MKKRYIIGIDGGSQSTKVVIFDTHGKVVSEGTQPLKPMNLPQPGIVEHPDDDLWESLCEASKQAMESFPGRKEDIIGVGLCTIRFVRCLLKKDGTLASPAMSWMDGRVSKPYEHLDEQVSYVTTSSGYITHRLTGQLHDSAGNYQGMWPIDTDTWDWSEDEAVFRTYQIPREMLFDLKLPGNVLGQITKEAARETGMPEQLPVIATANDKAVEALGAGVLSESTALISLGTYIAGMITGHENPKETNHFWTNFAAIPNEYLYESEGIRRGMWTVSWFKELLGDELSKKAASLHLSPEEFLNNEAVEKVPAGSDGLMTVLDWLSPADEPYKKGMMLGFDGRHTRAHIYHSILEGIALTMKTNVDNMIQELDTELDQIVVSGGGAKGDLMMQLFADVFGLPAMRNKVKGSASLGAAINTAVALEIYPSYHEAIEEMVDVDDTFSPHPENHEFYTKMNEEVYQQISNHTDGILKKAHSFFNG
ncbi:FGGY family carbohydrate kinase [Halobacillus salinarum]|uniref:FGGY family carbohydrate kinase n=1 Tax=Halobacillus salinarum TaxID=2932257 RepID=A0ABY4EJB0_9BACI|nr:FGGY family carbohydrate kinase [Halobacillus salinarum]UOQ44239.1 FGGY family carbohydrate kinase [Halobacillus salinarum]